MFFRSVRPAPLHQLKQMEKDIWFIVLHKLFPHGPSQWLVLRLLTGRGRLREEKRTHEFAAESGNA